jgi:hypothetical protein
VRSINQKCITNNCRYTVHHNLRGKPNGRKPWNSFLYIEYYIYRKHQLPNSLAPTGRRLQPPIYMLQPEGSYNSLDSSTPTRRRLQTPNLQALKEDTTPCVLQLQPEGGYDPLIYKLQPKGIYNSLCSLTPIGRRLRPPLLASSSLPKIQVINLLLPLILSPPIPSGRDPLTLIVLIPDLESLWTL